MTAPDFWLKKDITSMARSARLAVVQNQLDAGNLTEDEARELLAGPLTPGDDSTIVDDSEWLNQYLIPRPAPPWKNCVDTRRTL